MAQSFNVCHDYKALSDTSYDEDPVYQWEVE